MGTPGNRKCGCFDTRVCIQCARARLVATEEAYDTAGDAVADETGWESEELGAALARESQVREAGESAWGKVKAARVAMLGYR